MFLSNNSRNLNRFLWRLSLAGLTAHHHVPVFVKIGQQIGVSPKKVVIENNTVGVWCSNLVWYEIQTVDAENVNTHILSCNLILWYGMHKGYYRIK
jgi:hypothetical protein